MHLYGLAHVVHPVNPIPAHCPQRAAVQPEGAAEEVVVATVLVVLVLALLVVLVVLAVLAVLVVVEPVKPNHSISAAPLMGMLWVTPAP